jgi:DNA invertase Pin-like site-specific DNA recombinase
VALGDGRCRRATFIRTRTAEGRSRAQKRGQHMGRPPKLTEAQKAEVRRRRAQGATLAELARSYDVGKTPSTSVLPGR